MPDDTSQKPMTIQELLQESWDVADSKGWNDKPRTVEGDLLLLHSEISEACEDLRNGREPNEIYYEDTKPCGIPVEMADLVIRVAHWCYKYKVNLEDVIRIKTAYNKTRPYRHGGKIL